LLIVNPISGGIDKSELIATVQKFATNGSTNLTVYKTSGEDDESQIKELYQQHQFERAIIAGGDGTIKMVAEALADTDIVFGILPSGSANGLAKDLDLPD